MSANLSGPDFLCIGLQKAGTGWLFDQLDFHPDFWMPPLKELHYFDSCLKVKKLDSLLRRMQSDLARVNKARLGLNRRSLSERDVQFLVRAKAIRGAPQDLDKYADLFAGKEGLLSGDITPGYCTLPENTIKIISDRFPNVKIVLLLRNPVERIWSQINMGIRKGKLTEAEAFDWDRIKANLSRDGFSERSYPSEIWRRWTKFISAERMGYFFFDDLRQRPVEFRANILKFLGADPEKPSGGRPADYNRKSNHPKISMSQSVRDQMIDFFHEELVACASIFGGQAKEWLSSYGLAGHAIREEA